jgi:hypothetical protein
VGSRVHGAASACLITVGLFLCGLGGALALAEPSASPQIPRGAHSEDPAGKGPKGDTHGSGTKASPDEDPDTATATDKPGKGANPGNGNCGNGGSNGNAQGCSGGTPETTPPSPSTTKPPTTTPPTTSDSTTPATSSPPKTTPSSETSTETSTSTTTTSVGLPAPGGGGGGGVPEAPAGGGALPPKVQLPPASEPSVIDSVPGVGAAAADLPVPPITLPVIVAPAAGLGAGGAGAPAGPALPGSPRGVSAEPPAGREPLPANAGSNAAIPQASYRVGYADYLRNAGLSQVAALAVPGVAGMLILTGAGGLVGYRQAKAGHAVHTSGTARFMN